MDEATNGNAADLHDQRLMALLRDLVREQGRARTAEALAVDPRTLAACLKRGRPSRLMRAALERRLDAGPAQKEDTAVVEREARVLSEAVAGELKALREEHAEALGQLEQRLERLESSQSSTEAPPAQDGEAVVAGPPPRAARQSDQGAQETPQPERKPAVEVPSTESPEPSAKEEEQAEPATRYRRRLYPELVTEDPAPDDAEVYGEAWLLVVEWRRLWGMHARPGKGLEWLRRDERILELEVAMLEEHRLTLPPATFPQHGVWRHGQLGWRWKALHDAQRARAWGEARRWAGRVLTSGLLLGLAALMVLIERSSTPG